jgi:hypothetical protein
MAISRSLFRAGILSGGFWGVFTGFFSYLILSLNRSQVTTFLDSSGTSPAPSFQTFAFVLVIALIILGLMGGIIISIIFERTGQLFGKLSASKRGIILGIIFGLLFVLIYPFPGDISDIGYILISALSGYFLASFYLRFSRRYDAQKNPPGKK